MSPLSKRMVDVCVALVASVLLMPLIGVVAIAIRYSMGAPVFFPQVRLGYEGKRFELLKFRTMSDARGADGSLLPDSERLTRLGSILRRFSLDELPQLWNVLKGEMSLVGPRPLLVEYLDRYTPEQMRRHDVKPGITGWAQVNGRNALSWEERFRMDVWYVDHWSLGLDAKILLMTAVRVASPQGISQRGHATMPEFMGKKPS
jgi:sugar transferase EpsL